MAVLDPKLAILDETDSGGIVRVVAMRLFMQLIAPSSNHPLSAMAVHCS
jgi:Fe-S cluster assembly ATPase SufC